MGEPICDLLQWAWKNPTELCNTLNEYMIFMGELWRRGSREGDLFSLPHLVAIVLL